MPENNLTREEARRRASIISKLSYRVALDLTAGEESYGSDTTIHFACSEPGATTFLDFLSPGVSKVTLNGEDVPTSAFDGVRIHLPALKADNEVHVVVASQPYEHTGVGLHRFVDPVDKLPYLHTQFEAFDAHRVFPCFDQPDLKATFDFEVSAPENFEVCSNMAPASRPDAGKGGRWVFKTTPVMSTYLGVIVAGPFAIVTDKHGDIDLGLWIRQSLAQYLEAEEMFEITKQGFDYFAKVFDYPYPFGKYDQLFVPEFNAGAMENIGAVTFSESYVFRSKVTQSRHERRAETVLHEMAHMWFGDLVTMTWWDDLWLNESFATFMALISQVNATRFKNGFVTFADAEKTWAYRQDQLPTTHPIAADCPDVTSVEVNFDGISYAKGASVLRQLVAWVGEEKFFEGLRGYFRRYEYSNADLAGFLDALEAASGRDLHLWSKQWLQTAGVNTLRAQTEIDGDMYSSFAVSQEATPEFPTLRSHRIAIGLYDATNSGLTLRKRVELDVTGPLTPVAELAGEKVPDLLLLNDGDLTFAKIRFDERSLKTLATCLHDLTDPLARSLSWTMTWDMVRDAELASRDYVRIALGNVTGESDIGVLQSLLGKSISAPLSFGEPSNRRATLQLVAEAAHETALRQKGGTDDQLVWVRTFVSAARTPGHVAVVRGLLDGQVPFEGLAVDTDLRWHIVKELAAIGAVGTEEIEAEAKRDATDQGARHAAGARVGRPDPEAKAEAWSMIVDDSHLPFATMRAMMSNFHHYEQESILKPYAARYFDAVLPMWEARDIKVALEFAEDMYPHTQVSQETVKATDKFLGRKDVPGPIRRMLIEGRDGIQRALRARAKDAAVS